MLLQNKTSFDSSVKLLKKQTINQFSSKCCDIYKNKIEIHLLNLKNKNIFSSYKKNNEYNHPKIVIKGDIEELCSDPSLKNFLFYFRENNEEMLKLINIVNKEQRQILIPFLCHFFYENFFMESAEQEEIFYIIYLLLEKEIDNLCAPLSNSFLNDSFLAEFLLELGNKYEIKNYIDITLNSVIREINEVHSNYFSMNIISKSKSHYKKFMENKETYTFWNMKKLNFSENELFFSRLIGYSEDLNNKSMEITLPKKAFSESAKNKNKLNKSFHKNMMSNQKKELKYEKKPINELLDKNFFNIINENNIKYLYENEKDKFMKCFFIKKLKQIRSFKNPNLYNCRNYFEKMIKAENISKTSIEYYNYGYKLITEFIDKLFSKLEVKVIIPYGIKIVCKLIYLLLKKKFQNISEMQLNIMVCRFLFDKLIIPILENPDGSNIAKIMMISLNSRKNLFNISIVLKKFINGELFSEEKYDNFKIFNKFIIENYHRLEKIIHNFIDVKLPTKIELLLNQFYNNENFSLDNCKRKSSEINYDYFKENSSEFMQHDSICFNLQQFFLFFDIVNNNKNIFIIKGSTFEKVFNDLSKYVESELISRKNKNYYLIIKENYSEEEKKLLFHTEKNIGLSKTKTPEELLFKLKFCITHLLSKLEILPQWDWVQGNYDTKEIFNLINKYLTMYKKKDTLQLVPLKWYSNFILKNLELINDKYKDNDYNLLYTEIKEDVYSLIEKLKKLNEFLTVNIRTKFDLIENRNKNYEKELIEMEKAELNIKALLFIESAEINVCYIETEQYNEIQKYAVEPKSKKEENSFVLSNVKYCPHNQLLKNESQKIKQISQLIHYHCKNIKKFAFRFSQFQNIISEEVVKYYFGSDVNPNENRSNEPTISEKKNGDNIKSRDLNENIIITTKSPKDILNIYMSYVSKILKKHSIFNKKNISDDDDYEEEIKIKKRQEEDKEKALKMIWSYILQILCNKIYDSKPLDYDELFQVRCISLSSFVKPTQLKISPELCDQNLLNKIIYHLKKMDRKRTPQSMNQEFGIAVQLISSLFKFYLNQTQIEAGDLLPFIIYSIISMEPQRIIFNICFCRYFLSESELLGSIGYNMIQGQSSINYINKIDPKQLGISDEEYNKSLIKIKFH